MAWHRASQSLVLAGGTGSLTSAACKATHHFDGRHWRSFPSSFGKVARFRPAVCTADADGSIVLVLWEGNLGVEIVVWRYEGEGRWRTVVTLPVPIDGLTKQQLDNASFALAYRADDRKLVFARYIADTPTTTLGAASLS
jgi:hypothetical protein